MYPISSQATQSNLYNAYVNIGGGFGQDNGSLAITHLVIHTPTKVAKHPVESGSVKMDNKVLEPIEIEATCILYISEYDTWMQRLYKALDDKSDTTYTVQTKTDVYENLVLRDIVETQSKDKYDVVELKLKFIEMMKANVSKEEARGGQGTPQNSQDSKNVNSGEAAPLNPGAKTAIEDTFKTAVKNRILPFM